VAGDDVAMPGCAQAIRLGSAPEGSYVRTMASHRQLEVADQIFTALKSADRWRAVYIDDMQKVLDSYNPA
jgi:hypothetical protein